MPPCAACAEYPYIDESYKACLLKDFEDTYFSTHILHADSAVYVERNYEMIDKSDFCVVYYIEDYEPPMRKNSKKDLHPYQPKSGTKIAYEYAEKKEKHIINIAKPQEHSMECSFFVFMAKNS